MVKAKSIKKITAALLACAAIVTSVAATNVAAYWDGDREVGYYSFDALGDSTNGVSRNNIKRLYDRQYVVSVTSTDSYSCGVFYYVSDTNGARKSYNSSTMFDVGNTGGSYYSTNTIGTYVRLDATVASTGNPNAPFAYQSGQWSPDNA